MIIQPLIMPKNDAITLNLSETIFFPFFLSLPSPKTVSHRIKSVRLRWSKTELSPDCYNTDYMVTLNQSYSIDCTDYDNPSKLA